MAPQAWHITIRDDDIPDHLWLHNDGRVLTPYEDPIPGSLHKIASLPRSGMGHSTKPVQTYSHYGLLWTGTTYGGGGTLPVRSWKPGEKIHKVRKLCTAETIAAASLPDDFETFLRQETDTDEFVTDCVNSGWPGRMTIDLQDSIIPFLRTSRKRIRQLEDKTPSARRDHKEFMGRRKSKLLNS